MPQNRIEQSDNILVIGSTGTVGMRVIEKLLAYGFRVHAATNDKKGSVELEERFVNEYLSDELVYYRGVDAYSISGLQRFEQEYNNSGTEKFCALVFCLAIWPQNGFMEEVPLRGTNFSDAMWDGMCERYVQFFARSISYLMPFLIDRADIIFVTSGIADLAHPNSPPWLTAQRYQRAKEVLDSFVECIKQGKFLAENNTSIHRIGLTAKRSLMGHEFFSADIAGGLLLIPELLELLDDALLGDVLIDNDLCTCFDSSFVMGGEHHE